MRFPHPITPLLPLPYQAAAAVAAATPLVLAPCVVWLALPTFGCKNPYYSDSEKPLKLRVYPIEILAGAGQMH